MKWRKGLGAAAVHAVPFCLGVMPGLNGAHRAFAAERSVAMPAANARARAEQPGVLRILAIGVDDPGGSFFPPLKWAESDARSLARALGRGTERAPTLEILLGAAATRDAVRLALAKLARESRPQDDVVVYFSGHGTLAVSGEGRLERVLVLRGTTPDAALRTGLSVAFLRDLLEAIPARRKAAILASCHSGAGKSKVTDEVLALLKGAKGAVAIDAPGSEGVLVLAAAAREEAAREDDALRGDIYTRFFTEGLDAGDLDGDGAVNALEAHEYARKRTLAYTQGRQRPSLEARVVGEGEVVLAGQATKSRAPLLQAYGDAMRGIGLKANGADKGSGPQGFALDSGRNEIELYAEGDEGKPIARYVVNAEEGETLGLEDLGRPMPLRAAISLGLGFAGSSSSGRTYGDSRALLAAWGEWRFAHATVALGAEASSSEKRQLAPGVRARLSSAVYPMRGTVWWPLFLRAEGGPWAELFHERQTLTLSDAATGTELSRKAEGLGWGAGLALHLPFAWRFEQEVGLGYRHFSKHYGDWGRADSKRVLATWTFSCAFGRYVRRLK